jgi:AraC-like DNA-binding protein
MYLDGKQTFVHRLVCELVNGAAPSLNHEAAHSCGNGHLACINKKHLRWATRAENHADKLIHGTANRGERHGLARLNEDAVRKIRSLAGTLSQQRIAREVGCSRSQVMRILSGECWGWLQ